MTEDLGGTSAGNVRGKALTVRGSRFELPFARASVFGKDTLQAGARRFSQRKNGARAKDKAA